MSPSDGLNRYPPSPRGPKHSGWQLLKIPIMLSVYSLPLLIRYLGPLPEMLTLIILFIGLAIPPLWIVFGILVHAETIDWGPKNNHKIVALCGFPRSGRWAPTTNPVDEPMKYTYGQPADIDLLKVEYESLVSEAKYRDKLLLRTTYYSLGTLGLFVALLTSDTLSGIDGVIAMVASIVMLAFAIGANSYKDSRDALWDRIGRLENTVPEFEGRLTTFNTIRSMDRRLLNTMSLSSYSVGLTIFMTISSYCIYALIMVNEYHLG